MKAYACVLTVLLTVVLTATSAEARRRPRPDADNQQSSDLFTESQAEEASEPRARQTRHHASRYTHASRHHASSRHHVSTSQDVSEDRVEGGHHGVGPRPSQWCGWYMRTRHGGGAEYNLAANWRHYGSAASPQAGAIVVWSHHVGEITGRASNGQWIVLSGNDSHRVRERPRSIAGASIRM